MPADEPWPRTIMHLDMDAFFAAVEIREDPSLRGKPLLIGHNGPRGVVMTASYEARVFGCHSAQPMAVAKRLCPHAEVRPTRFELYRQTSDAMMGMLRELSPLVQPVSIDEAFVDLTGSRRLLGDPVEISRRLKDRISRKLGVTASIGLAANKFLAKLASDLQKPDGLTVIAPSEVQTLLPPLSVSRLWGVGKVTEKRLADRGIRTIGDLLSKPPEWLERVLGSDLGHYLRLARGQDDRPVTNGHQAKSIGHERTFSQNLAHPQEVRRVLLDLVELVATRLRRHGLTARGVSLKIRYGSYQTINRSATLTDRTDSTEDLWLAARSVFDNWEFQPVRLIGVTAERLCEGGDQLDLFDASRRDRSRKLDAVADQINGRYGKRSIRRAGAG